MTAIHSAMLHLLCGKIAAGKSTLARQLAAEPQTTIVAEDSWLAKLYGDEMTTLKDYVIYSARLREALTPHLIALLNTGVSIVLDFPANTLEQRQWMRTLIAGSGCRHVLHYLDMPDDLCKARLAARNQAGEHDFAATEKEYELISRYFIAPQRHEGFNIQRHIQD